jgi:hypothetical protein
MNKKNQGNTKPLINCLKLAKGEYIDLAADDV